MNILFLSQWCEPEPTFKGLIFAKQLQKMGHEVEILTGFPNYPGGRLYEGYKIRPYQREEIDGISIHRVPLYPSHDKNPIRRIANYGSFAFSAALIGIFFMRKPEIIYVYHPPATVALPAAALKMRFGAKIVYDIQDMWPDTLSASGMMKSPTVLEVVNAAMKVVYKLSDRIVVLSPGFKKLLVKRGVSEDKIDVIYNWTFETDFSSIARDKTLEDQLGLSGHFNVVFAGTMGMSQGLDTVLDSAKKIAKLYPRVQFVFIGGGVDRERLEKRARDEELGNVLFLPRVSPYEMGPIMAATDVAIVHLIRDPLFEITIPSKIQGYMSAGRAILCGMKGDAAALVENAGCGLAFSPEDSDALVKNLIKLVQMPHARLREMGKNGKDFYDAKIGLKAGSLQFEKIFKECVGFNGH